MTDAEADWQDEFERVAKEFVAQIERMSEDAKRLDWLSTATVGRELTIGGNKAGSLHWVTAPPSEGIDGESPHGLRAAIDAAMERETGRG